MKVLKKEKPVRIYWDEKTILLTDIPSGNITELKQNNLYWSETSLPLRKLNRNKKPGWEIRLEGQIKKLQQPAKVLSKEKPARIYWDEKTKTKQQTSLMIQLKEINQRYQWKKEDFLKVNDYAQGFTSER